MYIANARNFNSQKKPDWSLKGDEKRMSHEEVEA